MDDNSEVVFGLERGPLPVKGATNAKKLVKPRTDSGKEPHQRRQSLKRALHLGKSHPQPLSVIPTAIPTQADVQASYEEKPESRRLNTEAQSQGPSILSKVIHDPIDTTKSLVRGRVAEELSGKLLVEEVPHHHNVELLESHVAISEAEDDTQRQDATGRRDILLRAQQKELLLWTLNRHVKRVKVVEDSILESEAQVTDSGDSLPVLLQFAQKYGSHCIGYGTYPPPLTQDVLTSIAERLFVVSVSLQHLAMALRRIYRWEDTYETAAYLSLYLLLWSTGMLLPATLFLMVLFVLTRHAYPPSFEDLKRELTRIEDASQRSRSITEFATKHNQQDWLTPLGEALGPALLVQLGLTDTQSFYEWRNAERTSITTALLAVFAIVLAGTPSWLLVKSFTLLCGLVFFFCFPISSRYPNYRLIVSPKTWLFWKIPTHAEWAIAVVQREARETPASEEAAVEIARYSCHWKHWKGSLVVTNYEISFIPALSSDRGWDIRYTSLQRMEKRERHSHARSGEDLLFTLGTGTEYLARDVHSRDEVFVQIIGHAGVSWLPEW